MHTSDPVLTLKQFLPPAPVRLLLLTDAPAPQGGEWVALGYDVRVGSVRQPGEYIQHPTPTRQGICDVRLGLDAGSCGAALIQGLSPQAHPLALFNELAQVLVDNATLVLTGSATADPSPRMQHWLDHAVAIGARCGFAEQPLGDVADVGGRGDFVRVLRKSGTPRWQLRHVRPAAFDEIATLFREVFGHPLSRELWDWKYAQGRGNAVVAARNGVSIAHYGGIYREVLLFGAPEWTLQICDVMVHPKERGVMTRQGPFLLTAATSAEIYGPLGFGFPNSRAMLVAEKMGLYSEVGSMVSVRWEPSEPGYRWRTRARALAHQDPADQAKAQSLWDAMAKDLESSVVGIRDWEYLKHRYCNHPHNRYELLLVSARLTGSPLGILVLHRLEDACELLDVIAPLANLPTLIDQARRVTRLWGLSHLYCWISKNQAQHFLRCGDGKEEVLNVSIPTSCWTHDPRAEVFKDRWWLMSGDTDFR